MKNRGIRMFAVTIVACFLSVVPWVDGFHAAEADAGSPLEYFAEQNAETSKNSAAILAATTPEELIKLGVVHKRMAKSYLANASQLSPEDKAGFVNEIKGSGLATHLAVAERIDGDRAVVMRESPHPGAWNIIVNMNRVDGVWTPGSEHRLQNLTGARASFTVTGSTTAEMTDGFIEQTTLYAEGGEKPYLVLSDMLEKVLTDLTVPMVEFMPPRCPTLGSHALSTEIGRFTTGGVEFVKRENFDENFSGTLEITKIEGNRYWGNFEIKVDVHKKLNEAEPSKRAVSVKGTMENVPNSCPDGA
jgi:hypothetical protein